MSLTICIPTYNRANLLARCLSSIFTQINSGLDFSVIVSDNNSSDNTSSICKVYAQHKNFFYYKNDRNLGILGNFIAAVKRSNSEFIWLLGDDDLMLDRSLINIFSLFKLYPKVDFFYLNSYNSNINVGDFKSQNLIYSSLPLFSNYKKTGVLKFSELINRNISFDFLGAMYMNVFRRTYWESGLSAINQNSFEDKRTFSNFDNTFPHIKIFASAFMFSKAYYSYNPFTINYSGARDWAHMYPLIYSVRIPEALDFYRANGLGLISYLKAKNSSLDNFAHDYFYLLINRNIYKNYFTYTGLLFKNCLFPNFYLSLIYPFLRKLKKLFNL